MLAAPITEVQIRVITAAHVSGNCCDATNLPSVHWQHNAETLTLY